MKPQRPDTTVDDVYQMLYDRIMEGVYPPERKLLQLDLAADLNVSRTPLREALNRLQAEKLVVSSGARGVEVAGVHVEETEQLYALRLMVEPPVVAGICSEFTEDDFQAMRDALEEMDHPNHRIREYQAAHLRFHEIALAHYPQTIRDLVESAYLKIARHQYIYFLRPQATEDFNDIDRLYLEALEQRDGSRARMLLELHLIDAALGLCHQTQPDFSPAALLMAAQGMGIEIECDERKVPLRPARIRWRSRDIPDVPPLKTSNLELITD